MRKIVSMLMVLCVISPAIAEIKSAQDAFDGTQSMASIINVYDLDESLQAGMSPVSEAWLMFSKPAKGPAVNGAVFLTISGRDRPNNEGKLKVDGKIKDIIIIEQPSDNYEETKISMLADAALINTIRTAGTITLRVNFTRSGNIDWQIPAVVLAEWKEFIRQAREKKFLPPAASTKKPTPRKTPAAKNSGI